MTTSFKHPLARDAKVWRTAGVSGQPMRLLVVITTLHLDEAHDKFRADKVQRLSDAARDWIRQHAADVADVLLVNRPRDWQPTD